MVPAHNPFIAYPQPSPCWQMRRNKGATNKKIRREKRERETWGGRVVVWWINSKKNINFKRKTNAAVNKKLARTSFSRARILLFPAVVSLLNYFLACLFIFGGFHAEEEEWREARRNANLLTSPKKYLPLIKSHPSSLPNLINIAWRGFRTHHGISHPSHLTVQFSQPSGPRST